MNDDKKRIPWSKIVIGVIIYALFMLWVSQRNENEQAKKEFAIQTGRAENQEAASASATQEIENKVKGCIGIGDASSYEGSNKCVVGNIVDIEEATTTDSSEPTLYYTYFSFMPTEFFIFGDKFLGGFIGDCVVVTGRIGITPNGTPYIIASDLSPDFRIESLPDNVCLWKP